NDIEELKHNWIFRLDRIHTAELIEINRQWEDDLQRVPVEFHLFDRLVYNYESKPEDIEEDVALIPENRRSERKPCREKARYCSPYKKVIRNVFSTFWFFRDIAKYWENCEIISPENVRQEFIKKLQQLNRNYQSTLPKDRT
ncbi:MAG: WYL domain-containing protein, partial [Cyanobacteria bacterium J083]